MKQKRVVTIQDISCLGKCSLTVALPILSAMDTEACVIPTAVLCVIAAVSAVKNRGAYNKKILQYVDIVLFFLLAAVVLWAGINHFLFADVITGGSAVSLPDGYHLVSRGEIVANITKAQFIEISLAEIKLIMSECAAFSFIAAFLFKISANYLKRSGSPV